MQETRKPQKEEKRSLEKKDTENMEMKKPEEQAKPKKKKITVSYTHLTLPTTSRV